MKIGSYCVTTGDDFKGSLVQVVRRNIFNEDMILCRFVKSDERRGITDWWFYRFQLKEVKPLNRRFV